MENFGDRLSVDDIWRVVLFVKTIPNGTLRQERRPGAERLHHLAAVEGAARLAEDAARSSTDNASFAKTAVTDPFMQEAMRVFPGLAPGDSFLDQRTARRTLSLEDAAAGIRTIYQRPARTGRGPTRRRAASKLPPMSQKAIPPTVPGQQ